MVLLLLRINQTVLYAAALTRNMSVYIKQRDAVRHADFMSLTSSTELTSSGEIPQTLQLSNKRCLKLGAGRRRRRKKILSLMRSLFGCQSYLPAHACVRIIFHRVGGRRSGGVEEGKDDASRVRELSALATAVHSSVFLLR